eukprot:6181055-Pleurochrysis_carterae.AAC.2
MHLVARARSSAADGLRASPRLHSGTAKYALAHGEMGVPSGDSGDTPPLRLSCAGALCTPSRTPFA